MRHAIHPQELQKAKQSDLDQAVKVLQDFLSNLYKTGAVLANAAHHLSEGSST